MSLSKDVEVLRNVPMFANIEPSKIKLLAFTSERLTFKPGESLCRQGELGDAAFIIVSGTADVIVDAPGGPLTVAELGRNDVVGEIAILCDVPRTATVAAKSEVVALKVTKDLFFQMVKQFPQMSVEIMRELALRLDKTTRQLRAALTENAEESGR